jgi:hypothetical protein
VDQSTRETNALNKRLSELKSKQRQLERQAQINNEKAQQRAG